MYSSINLSQIYNCNLIYSQIPMKMVINSEKLVIIKLYKSSSDRFY